VTQTLCRCVEEQVTLFTPDADGATLYQTLLSVEKQTGRRDPRLEVTPIPEAGQWCWWLFWEMHGMRQYGEFGPKRITLHDISVWMDINEEQLGRDDRETILALDVAYLNAAFKAKENNG
jgi:hypothetical protein